MAEWEIDKSQQCCYGTGEKIEYGQEYFSALVETDQGFERRDFTAGYWQEHNPQVYCYWKTRLPQPDQKKQIFIDDEMLMLFFQRLATETEDEKLNFRYVLTLILMRKRRLKYDSSRIEDDREIWRLRVVGEDRYVEVTNPHLDESQIEQVSSQLDQILQVEL